MNPVPEVPSDPAGVSVWGVDTLPEEIVMEVFDRLILLDDMVAFGAVCKSWRSLAKICTPLATVPFLMLPRGKKRHEFYCLAHSRIHRLRAPPLRAKKRFGIGFGWILSMCDKRKIDMVHPLRRCRITSLPSGYTLAKSCRAIRKVVASADPSCSSCIIMVIFRDSHDYNQLSYAKPGYVFWVSVYLPSPLNFMDVVFYRDSFYAVTQGGHISVCTLVEVGSDDYNLYHTNLETRSTSLVDEFSQKYLVESRTGELLLVCRSRDFAASEREGEAPTTNRFEVLRLEEVVGGAGPDNKREYEYARVESLGDQALFLGDNTSFSATASPANGCKSNSIYFTHDQFGSDVKPNGSDTGIYNLGDGKIERIPAVHSLSSFCPTLWYI